MDLGGLNDAQRQAVLHGDAPLLVLAGAGTGKTTVVTHRIAHLMAERGVPASRILAVTFTNKAAREMRERAARLAEHDARQLDIGTFHGMCGKLLRIYGERLGLNPRFVIYDEDDQLQLIRRCATDMNLDPQAFPARNIRGRLEQWKNQGKTPDTADVASFDMLGKKAADLYRIYEKRLVEANAVDFGNMLLHAVTLVKKDDHVREALQRRWTHLLVDEYQDTNPVQFQLIHELATPRHSVTVVGDDDQSIYRWRGADIGNILRFEKDFPDATIIRLEENYRSTQNILDAANAVIAHNVARKGKTLYTRGDRGEKLRFRLFGSERDEGEAIALDVQKGIEAGLPPDEVGVLYRTNAQSRPLEDALRRRRIPYVIYGGVRFYDRREVKDALAYLRLLVNPRSEIDFLRVVNAPARGIGKTSLERLQQMAAARGMSLYEAAERVALGEGEITGKARTGLVGFVELLHKYAGVADEDEPGRVVGQLLEDAGYLTELRVEGTAESQDRIENLQELVAAIDEYVETAEDPTLAGFLEEVALATDVDLAAEETGRVNMMTMHSAKGLEFKWVFLPGLEEGLFPHSRSLEEKPALEEERRLFYVGVTRAREKLALSAARIRTVFGRPELSELSRFVAEIPSNLLELGELTTPGTPASVMADGSARAPFRDELDQRADWGESGYRIEERTSTDVEFAPGSRVFHATFGEGLVVSADGSGKQRRLTIDFPKPVGRKVIVARFVEPRGSG
jgi:DNA helicase II / ATP-dependent DNA helicase PcrA